MCSCLKGDGLLENLASEVQVLNLLACGQTLEAGPVKSTLLCSDRTRCRVWACFPGEKMTQDMAQTCMCLPTFAHSFLYLIDTILEKVDYQGLLLQLLFA